MEFITLELRPRLQSCNVFITMQKYLCLKNIQVKISENNIVLMLKDYNINLLLSCVKVIPTSLSMLNIKENWICFRLQTTPLESIFGSFNTEIVTDLNKSVPSIICSQPSLENNKILFKTTEYVILCTCCKNVISKSVIFKRLLPFPDIEYDFNEWFCCKHNSNNISNNIETQESDYLYGSYFSVLHKSLFENNLHLDNKTLTCNKCLLHIGMLQAYNLFKIWNCCIDYIPRTSASTIVNATNPLNDFLILVNNSLNEILGEEIILKTAIGKQTHYLLIKPMDCKLNLITEPDRKVFNNVNTISLQQKCVAKVLYKYDTNAITTATSNYSNIKYHEVSLRIIEAGLKHLLSSTKRLPHIYRTVADCFLGYIMLQEIIK